MIFTETKILVHLKKKFPDIIIIFRDFPEKVVTLSRDNIRNKRVIGVESLIQQMTA